MSASDTKKTSGTADRRGFLKMLGVSAATGGAALAAKPAASQAAEQPRGKESGDYRETEHVKRYYELAKF